MQLLLKYVQSEAKAEKYHTVSAKYLPPTNEVGITQAFTVAMAKVAFLPYHILINVKVLVFAKPGFL